MDAHLEIVQIVGGRVFDEECYERAVAPEMAAEWAPGFYAVTWPSGRFAGCLDASAVLIGPFESAEQAGSVARERARSGS
jgi:hypothetical protein